jgi:biopolymer transport protein ExbB
MLSQLFLGISLIGAEWVLYLLILISVLSIAIIFERVRFYRQAQRGLADFRARLRTAAAAGQWDEARKLADERARMHAQGAPDLESGLSAALLAGAAVRRAPDVLTEVAQDSVMRARIQWEKNLAVLATIGSNAPFVGLFGTVLGIIKAFHDLSRQAGAGVQTVTSGISEALIATAVGILVAIPAAVAFNLFQRRVRFAITEAEALKSFLVGRLAE